MFNGFLPAISDDAMKQDESRGAQAGGCIAGHTLSLNELAAWVNQVVPGWVDYYGRYYRTALRSPSAAGSMPTSCGGHARSTNGYGPLNGPWHVVDGRTALQREPDLFTHWRLDVASMTRTDEKSPVTGDCHAGSVRGMTNSSGVRVPCGG